MEYSYFDTQFNYHFVNKFQSNGKSLEAKIRIDKSGFVWDFSIVYRGLSIACKINENGDVFPSLTLPFNSSSINGAFSYLLEEMKNTKKYKLFLLTSTNIPPCVIIRWNKKEKRGKR